MKILLGDFNAKVGTEDIFKPEISKDSLHEASNYNGVRIVSFVTSKHSHTVTFINELGILLMVSHIIRYVMS
jgi:hypothetical protein